MGNPVVWIYLKSKDLKLPLFDKTIFCKVTRKSWDLDERLEKNEIVKQTSAAKNQQSSTIPNKKDMNRSPMTNGFHDLQVDTNKNLAMNPNMMVNTNGAVHNGAKVNVNNNAMNGSNDINLLGSPGLKKPNNGLKNTTYNAGPNLLFDF